MLYRIFYLKQIKSKSIENKYTAIDNKLMNAATTTIWVRVILPFDYLLRAQRFRPTN